MSQDFMDPELFADFIVEAREHLETIEPNLLELERAPDDPSLLNRIFRPMHSLKGASGFLGLTKMNTLAHRAENVLDALRKGELALSSEIMDVVLSVTDILSQMIDSLAADQSEGDAAIEPVLAVLDGLLEKEAAPSPRAASPDPVMPPVEDAVGLPAPASGVDVHREEPAQIPPASVAGPGFSGRQNLETEAWIGRLQPLPAYALTTLGEGHLRDFVEEAGENLASLGAGLLQLEKTPSEQTDLVNDLFRYFHNLKGNSGIIGFQEVNGLTHEAETLLNGIRKRQSVITPPLVDLLLLVVDVIEALVARIDLESGQAAPFDASELLDNLRRAVAGETPSLPSSLVAATDGSAPQGLVPAERAQLLPASTAPGDPALFAETVGQQLEHIRTALADLRDRGEGDACADAVYRSLKATQNSCAFMGLEDVREYAERTAGLVDQARTSGVDFSIMADILEQECAIIADMLTAAGALAGAPQTEDVAALPVPEPHTVQQPSAGSRAEAAPPADAPPVAAETEALPAGREKKVPPRSGSKTGEPTTRSAATIRVDHEKLDHLMNLIGELIINRNRYAMLARQLEDSAHSEVGLIAQNLSETTYALARISDELQDTIMKVRMVPVSSVFSRFPRLVRDLSRKSGKEIDLIMEGEDTELDKSVVEVIGDPLVHLIRNSLDHGIESPEARVQAGKNPRGTVWLRAYYKGNSVAIEIEDDGKGIDPEKLRDVAVRKNVISAEEARLLDDREAVELIFAPGFSSAEVVTDISGRGVGMDVVRTNIKNLKGSISISSEVGRGTRFTLSLPLTLAIIDALMVNVDSEMYAIPLDAVCETTKLEARLLTDIKGHKAVTLRGEVLGLVSLAELLGLPCHMAEQDVFSVVVIQDNDRRLGLVVDRLLERQEIVIKPLGTYLGDLKGISGATIMGDGSVILILDPHEIQLLATSKGL